MDMLQLGDQLRFGLEAADEVRLVGELWQDDLYGHIPVDEVLPGAINSAIGAFTDGFEQIVTLDGAGWGSVNPALLIMIRYLRLYFRCDGYGYSLSLAVKWKQWERRCKTEKLV